MMTFAVSVGGEFLKEKEKEHDQEYDYEHEKEEKERRGGRRPDRGEVRARRPSWPWI